MAVAGTAQPRIALASEDRCGGSRRAMIGQEIWIENIQSARRRRFIALGALVLGVLDKPVIQGAPTTPSRGVVVSPLPARVVATLKAPNPS